MKKHIIILLCLSLITVTYIVVLFGVFTPVMVSGSSMEPTLHNGDTLIAKRCDASKVKIGDIIIFKKDHRRLIKRVAGVPGDTVNDVVLGDDEYYVLGDNTPQSNDSRFFGPIKADSIKSVYTNKKIPAWTVFLAIGLLTFAIGFEFDNIRIYKRQQELQNILEVKNEQNN